MQVSVCDNNVEQALRALKKKLQREGVFREMKLKQHFEKPSEKKARERAMKINGQVAGHGATNLPDLVVVVGDLDLDETLGPLLDPHLIPRILPGIWPPAGCARC